MYLIREIDTFNACFEAYKAFDRFTTKYKETRGWRTLPKIYNKKSTYNVADI